jgi:hypothetical protein
VRTRATRILAGALAVGVCLGAAAGAVLAMLATGRLFPAAGPGSAFLLWVRYFVF